MSPMKANVPHKVVQHIYLAPQLAVYAAIAAAFVRLMNLHVTEPYMVCNSIQHTPPLLTILVSPHQHFQSMKYNFGIYLQSTQDEPFHVPQTLQYCKGHWHSWDAKITTFPGLYILGTAYCRLLHLFTIDTSIPLVRRLH